MVEDACSDVGSGGSSLNALLVMVAAMLSGENELVDRTSLCQKRLHGSQ